MIPLAALKARYPDRSEQEILDAVKGMDDDELLVRVDGDRVFVEPK